MNDRLQTYGAFAILGLSIGAGVVSGLTQHTYRLVRRWIG
jgi:hypothetical protein